MSSFVDYHEAPSLNKRLRASIISSIRRALTFTLYRNYDLALKVWDDLIETTLLSKGHLLGCLERIYKIFDHGKYRAYNKAYINDLRTWASK